MSEVFQCRSVVVLVATIVLGCFSGERTALAVEEESRLRQRIQQLEAENRALRKALSRIQSALEKVPKPRGSDPQTERELRIVIVPGDWGGSELEDIRKVCLSAAGTIWSEISDDTLAPVLVERSRNGPISLYQRGKGNEYVVKLDTEGNAWAQCAFQFAHEFCHVLCNYRDVENRQLWFEETLAECASLYALRRMAEQWKTEAPYPNWKSYAGALQDYAEDRINQHQGDGGNLAEFYQQHRETLEANATRRDLNGLMATRLLPMFEETPAAWQAVRFINLGPAAENRSFQKYLQGWHDRTPAKQQPFVRQLASKFDIKLAEKNNQE